MSGRIGILYVGADADRESTVARPLEAADDRFEVDTVSTAERGLKQLSDGRYDCVVSAYDLPDMDGVALLEAVRETAPDLPFVVVAADGSEAVASEAISAGVTAYLPSTADDDDCSRLADRIDAAVPQSGEVAAAWEDHPLDQILKTVPSCVVQLNRAGEFVFANERAEAVLGLEQAELTQRTYNDPEWEIRDVDGTAIPDSDLPFRRVFDTGEPVYNVRHTIRWPDGTERVLSVSGAPLFEDGRIESVVFSLTDITERQRYEDRLARLHEASRDLYEAESAEAIAETTSQAAAEILNFELNGVHLYSEDAGGLAPVAVSDTTEAMADQLVTFDRGIAWEAYQHNEVRCYGDVRTAEAVYDPETKLRTGLYFPLGSHGILILASVAVDDYDAADRSLGRLLAANATSALDRVERESLLRERKASLARQNRRLDEFASIVAHDLRTPLQTVDGRIRLARQTDDLEQLDDAVDTLGRMETLIDDLLTFAREGESVSETEPVSLPAAVESSWQTVPAADATLVVETDRTVYAEPARLRQVLVNLLNNGVTHGGDGVTITVGAFDGGFYVADDGVGISEADADRIFESAYTTAEDGTGFGLAIVRQIVEAHGWDIAVTEIADGGARFEVSGVEFSNPS